MAIDKNSKSMMDPYSKGNNFGITADFNLVNVDNQTTNYAEAMSANQRTSGIESMLSKVSNSGASGQENFDLKNLGSPANGNTND